LKITAETGQAVLAVDPAFDKLPDSLSPDNMKVVTLWLLSPERVTPDRRGSGLKVAKYEASPATRASPIGGNGNTVIAGHRDLAFRALRNIQAGDIVSIESIESNREAKTYAYRVERTRIVNPDDVSVLASDGQPRLTMITCHPFHYTGDAPKRYIVDARLVN
jgi:sortase A